MVKLALFGLLVYGIQNKDKITRWPIWQQGQVLGEETLPRVQRVWQPVYEGGLKPVQDTVEKGREGVADKVKLPETVGLKDKDSSDSEADTEKVDKQRQRTEQELDELAKEVKKLPQKQMIKVKEQIVKEVFPNCQCQCQIPEETNNEKE